MYNIFLNTFNFYYKRYHEISSNYAFIEKHKIESEKYVQ